jgi:phosphoribosylformimino-5-aminoimidazole carboxamide ribotide isomerase
MNRRDGTSLTETRVMRFRPCIDLRGGKVVQIVGGSLRDDGAGVVTNHESDRSPADFARLYREDGLTGGHVIALGPGNHEAALSALRSWPGGLQMGGGVTPENAPGYLDAGASHVIVTSYVFREGRVDEDRLNALLKAVGRERLVLDLSCRKRDGEYWVVTDRWQRFTDVPVTRETLGRLAETCAEFLVHGVDVEGMRLGIDAALVELLVPPPRHLRRGLPLPGRPRPRPGARRGAGGPQHRERAGPLRRGRPLPRRRGVAAGGRTTGTDRGTGVGRGRRTRYKVVNDRIDLRIRRRRKR